jgi:hypothetical protein
MADFGSPFDLEELAARIAFLVVEQLRQPDLVVARLLTVEEVASLAGRSNEWVRDHQAELGVMKIGKGKCPRLRFDPAKVREALTARELPKQESKSQLTRRRRQLKKDVELLPIGRRCG